MASISITVNETTGLFSIAIDKYWSGFSVINDGDTSQTTVQLDAPNVTTYTQEQPRMLWFQLISPYSDVQVVNQGLTMVLAGKSTNYMCTIVYAGGVIASASEFVLTGICQEVDQQNFPSTATSFSFSQTHMAGGFKTTA
jgi:hypothetical protein